MNLRKKLAFTFKHKVITRTLNNFWFQLDPFSGIIIERYYIVWYCVVTLSSSLLRADSVFVFAEGGGAVESLVVSQSVFQKCNTVR